MVENTWIVLNTAVSSTWNYVCGSVCYFLYKIIELKLNINVKYDGKNVNIVTRLKYPVLK